MTQTDKSSVRLGDVVRIAITSDKEIIANPDYARTPVNWLSVLIARDGLANQVEAHDVVLAPAHVMQTMTEPEMAKLLKDIGALGAAAVVLFGTISAEIKALAQEINLPTIVISADTSLREVNRNIASLLVDRQTQVDERGMQLYRELSEMSREGIGLQKMSDLIASVTGKIVVIQDKRLDIVALSRPAGSIAIDDEAMRAGLEERDNLPAVLRNRKAAAKASRTHWQQLLFPNHNVARMISPIISGDRARGYLSIIGAASELDLLDTAAVEQGSAACALEMAKAKAISEAKKALRGNFLEGILAGNIPQKEVERLAARLDHDTDVAHAVMTFKWSADSNASLRRVETTLNWLLSTNNQATLVHLYGDDHVAVFQTLRREEDVSEAQRLARRLTQQLEADYPDSRLLGGLSGPVLGLREWPQAHREALQAMEVGARLRMSEIVEYSSLGVYRLLGKLDGVTAVHEFCDQVIGPLVDYDREHRSNLVLTIEQYFNHHGNVSQTAESLFIHRNTLLYRLERIQDLTGHDLNQSDMRLALHLALKLWQLRPDTSG